MMSVQLVFKWVTMSALELGCTHSPALRAVPKMYAYKEARIR